MTPLRSTWRKAQRFAAALALLLVVGALGATPASAHGATTAGPTNYRTIIRSVQPNLPGVEVRAVDMGNDLELRSTRSEDVVVLGYQGEPYLRVGPSGTFANHRSPAYWVNQARDLSATAPPAADAAAPPEWRPLHGGHVVRWHDHRSHWMSSIPSPLVRAAPTRSHVVVEGWQVQLRVGDRPVVVTGDVEWVPAGSPMPWYLLALGAGALGVATGFARAPRWVAASSLVLLVAVDVVHGAGAATVVTGEGAARWGAIVEEIVPSAVAWVLGLYGAVRWWRGALDGAWLGLFSAAVIALLGGLSDVAALSRSQLPNGLPGGVARASVAVALGLGTGLVVSMGRQVRAQRAAAAASTEVDGGDDGTATVAGPGRAGRTESEN